MATIRINGFPLDRYKARSATLKQQNGGKDELVLSFGGDYDGDPPFAFGELVRVSIDGDQVFEGTVAIVSRECTDARTGFETVVRNAWQDLEDRPAENTLQRQDDPFSLSLSSVSVPRFFIGQDAAGNHIRTGSVIAQVLSFSASKGDDVTTGSIAAGTFAPQSSATDASCLEVIQRVLRFHPDWVTWVDGSNGFHALPESSLTTVTIDPGSDECEANIRSREDLTPVGVAIVWEKPVTIDGTTRIDYIRREAGSMTGKPAAQLFTIELAGAETTTQSVRIGTRTIPAADDVNSTPGKRFYQGLLSWLADASTSDFAIVDQELEFADPNQDDFDAETSEVLPNAKASESDGLNIADYPRQWLFGEVHEWVDGSSAERGAFPAVLSATIAYQGNDPAVLKWMETKPYYSPALGDWYHKAEIRESIFVTDAFPGLHRKTDTFNAGESPIEGLEDDYWNAVRGAKYEGVISADLSGKFVDLAPGKLVEVTGLMDEPAIVQGRTVDLIRENVSVSIGIAKHLDPDALNELSRVSNVNPPTWFSSEQRTEALKGRRNDDFLTGRTSPFPEAKVTRTQQSRLWDLAVYADGSDLKFRMIPGSLRKGFAFDGSDEVAISDIDEEFDASAGAVVYLEIDYNYGSNTIGDVTLVSGSTWSDWPEPFELEDDGGIDKLKTAYFPLWVLQSASSAVPKNFGERHVFSDNLVGYKLVPSSHLILVQHAWTNPDGNRINVISPMPSFGGLPATS